MTKRDYLYWVGRGLRNLPWKTRQSLLADLDGHLDEVSVEKLPPPDAYAIELRESAGLERRRGPIAYLRARRPRNLAIVGVLVVLVAALATGFAWVERYQPLAAGNYGMNPPGAHSGPAGEEAVTYRDGMPFQVGFSVLNRGAFTVRVSDGPHYLETDPFSVRLYVSGPLAHARTIPGRLVPFRPFDLPPGEQRILVLKGVFSHCHDWAGDSSFVFDSFPVTFSFLWRTETVRVPAPSPLVIQIPPGRRCLR